MLSSILTELTTTTIVVAIAGWIFRAILVHQVDKIQKHQSHSLALEIERTRAEWSRDLARLSVHESYLHKKRVELIEELWGYMIDAEFSLQTYLVSWWAGCNREELVERGLLPEGNFTDGENASWEERSREFCEKYLCMNALLHKNELFFEEEFAEKLKSSYKPFIDLVLDHCEHTDAPFPNELKDIVNVGQTPRRNVINSFRELLGVAHE